MQPVIGTWPFLVTHQVQPGLNAVHSWLFSLHRAAVEWVLKAYFRFENGYNLPQSHTILYRCSTVMRTRVKICGITRLEDALAAVRAGADAIGLVFYAPSPRAVTAARAARIIQRLPPFVSSVGLFVNATADAVAATLEQVPLDLLQFHGEETPAVCESHGRPYIKAVRMRPGIDLRELERQYSRALGLLLDSYQPGKPGGTGTTFDWGCIPQALRGRIILAGGLSPDNVEAAIGQVHPYAVDVSGGVEQEKGIKDEEKIRAFMRGVERASRKTD